MHAVYDTQEDIVRPLSRHGCQVGRAHSDVPGVRWIWSAIDAAADVPGYGGADTVYVSGERHT